MPRRNLLARRWQTAAADWSGRVSVDYAARDFGLGLLYYLTIGKA